MKIQSYKEYINDGYREYGRGIRFTDADGIEWTSVVSLRDNAGGIAHIVVDDHCYILYQGSNDRGFRRYHYIYSEIHNALKGLPDPATL